MGVVHCAVLFLHGILTSAQGEFVVLVPDEPFVAVVGEDVVLECELIPPTSASNMEVRWLKSGLDSPVHVYRHRQDDPLAQHQDYRARTELFKREMIKGNISLRIKNVRRYDEGRYICSVKDRTDYKRSAVALRVLGFGTEPRIQMKGYNGNGIQLVCRSRGWYPEPEILWFGEDGRVLEAETGSHTDADGLVNVGSSVGVTRQSASKLKCVIRNRRLKINQEAIIKISDDLFPAVPDRVLPLVLTICLLIAANSAVVYWNVKQHRRIKELELQKYIVESEWRRICAHEVSVTLDEETASPELEVYEHRKSVRRTGTWRSLPDTGKRFAHRPCVLGSEGFTSGRHYWEVEVGGNRRWSLGVAAESVERKENFRITPETGFWSIGRRGIDGFYVNTFPPSPLPVDPDPGRVGVYLSYESGTVSFYNAATKSHLHTFTGNKFTEKLYPLFGSGDKEKWLRICSRSAPGL